MIPDLAGRVRVLEEREAVRDLHAHYGWLVDTRQWDRVAEEVFTPGAVLVMGSGEFTVTGRDAIGAIYRERMGASYEGTAHYFTNLAVTLDGEDSATSRVYVQTYHWARETAGDPSRAVDFVGVGALEDRLVRTGPGWRVAHRVRRLLGPGPVGHGAVPPGLRAWKSGWGDAAPYLG